MLFRTLTQGLVSLTLLFATSPLFAESDASRRVAFKENPTKLSTVVNQEFNIDLRTLLSDQGSGNLLWGASATKPEWLELDSVNHRLYGTPTFSDAGVTNFDLSVGDGEAGDRTLVEMTVPAPPTWDEPLDLGLQHEGAPFKFDLKTKVNNPAGGAVAISAQNLPEWMQLDNDGVLTGTPKRKHVGEYSGIIFTAVGIGGSADAQGYGEVLKTIQPPKWVNNPIIIQDALEDADYAHEVSQYVSNPEGTVLTFSLVNSPSWIDVTSAGNLYGKPGKPDIGAVFLKAKFKTTVDGQDFENITELRFNVIHVNHPPKWLANPINLPPAFTSVAYNQDLSQSATDPDDNDKLSFSLVSGPDWAKLSTQGVISGIPQKADIGPNSWVVSVTDGEYSAKTTVNIEVIKSNEPPYWLRKPTVLENAKEDSLYLADLTLHAKDPDNDAMFFTKLSGPAWANITASGSLTGTPKADDVGITKLSVRVTDNISGNDVVDILIEIEHVNHAPEWVLNPIIYNTKEDAPMTFNISGYARDVDKGDKLIFSAISGPPWAQLTPEGVFSGTPHANEVGDNIYEVVVSDEAGLIANAKVIIRVEHVNHKPYWTQDPIVLPNAPERSLYTNSVVDYAKDPDPNDKLIFSKVRGPAWLVFTSQGGVTGTPQRKDLGLNVFTVRVMDQDMEFALVKVHITVDKVNIKPRWRMNPILLSDAFEDDPYHFDLSPYAVDDDGDKLTFSKVSGPDWLLVADNGKISGTPSKVDIGPYTAVFRVSDSQEHADADGKGQVIHRNHAPVIHSDNLVFEVKERETLETSLLDPLFIEDPDGDKINCSLIQPLDWVTLTNDCQLTIKPKHEHLGNHTIGIRADDGDLFNQGSMLVKVIRNPRPPVWLENPILMEARTNELFEASIANKAKDLDGIALTFHKIDGPDWLTIAQNGELSGTPLDSDLGENEFTVEARNDLLGAQAKLIITVKWGTQVETIQADSAVPGARIENMWIVDSSRYGWKLTSSVRANIQHYYDALREADIHHTGMFISASAEQFDGKPIYKDDMLLKWEDDNIEYDFIWRIDNSYCNTCYNTPVWSLKRFFDWLPTLPVYPAEYFVKNIPMESIAITYQRDHYPGFTGGTPQADYTPSDFADDFIDVHKKAEKSYRFNTMAPAPDKLCTPSGHFVGPKDTYQVITNKIGGKYYETYCGAWDMPAILKDYAQRVIFHAYVAAKRRINLSKLPMETDTMKVTLGGKTLIGNTGSADDQWTYDKAANAVLIQWHLIDITSINPGDLLIIEYRVS